MSSATPAAFWSAMSMTTTSASCLSATPRATVAPTFPAPPTTVTLRFMRVSPPNSAPVYHEGTKTHEDHELRLVQEVVRVLRDPSCLRDKQACELHLRNNCVPEIR